MRLYLNMACKGNPSSKAEIAHIAQIASHLCVYESCSLSIAQTLWLIMPTYCVNIYKFLEDEMPTAHRDACLWTFDLPDT